MEKRPKVSLQARLKASKTRVTFISFFRSRKLHFYLLQVCKYPTLDKTKLLHISLAPFVQFVSVLSTKQSLCYFVNVDLLRQLNMSVCLISTSGQNKCSLNSRLSFCFPTLQLCYYI